VKDVWASVCIKCHCGYKHREVRKIDEMDGVMLTLPKLEHKCRRGRVKTSGRWHVSISLHSGEHKKLSLSLAKLKGIIDV
jgi:hypothetical protein